MDIQAVKDRVLIMDVAAALGLSVNRNNQTLCPFHNEKSPSFTLYPKNNRFKCFGCGAAGDAIDLYSQVKGIDLRKALQELGGPDLEPVTRNTVKKPIQANTATQKDYSTIYQALQEYCKQSPANDIKRAALAYLTDRGLKKETITTFQIFVIADYAATSNYMKSRFSLSDLQGAGLFSESGKLIFYKHPLIIPFFKDGKIIYLQGRTIGTPPENTQKYQFLAGLSFPMFNQDILQQTQPGGKVYLTEGAFDAMIINQEGRPAVALGSASTFRAEWLQLFTGLKPVVAFDKDAAGQKGALKLKEIFTGAGISITQLHLPPGFKDITEFFLEHSKKDKIPIKENDKLSFLSSKYPIINELIERFDLELIYK